MKSSHLIVAISLGLLLGIVVFRAKLLDKPSGKPVKVPQEARSTPEPVSESAATSSASGLVTIPGGLFQSGSNRINVDVPAFRISRTEVTNGQYEAFLRECLQGSSCGQRDLPPYWKDASYLEMRRDHPVVFVSWEAASAYCQWEGGRLPTDIEWEKAARGSDGRSYPSGSALDPASVNIRRQGEKRHAPWHIATWGVHDLNYSRDKSPHGVLGMAGNVSEWTASASRDEPVLRLAAGGSFDSWKLDEGRVYHRLPKDRSAVAASLGFRCVFSPKTIAGDVLRVAAEPDTPPMLTTTEDGNYGGFDWEIANAIARRVGTDKVVIVPGPYSALPGFLISGKADVIVSGYTADPSITGVDWSDSYFDYGLCLIVRKGSPIRDIDDLRGKVIGIFNDPAAEADVKQLVRGYQRLEKFEDGYFDLLAEGQIDALLYDYPYTKEEIKPFADRLEIVQFNLTESTYNVGVRHGATDLLNTVNAAIRHLKASDEYGEMVRRHLGGIGPAPLPRIAANQEIYRVAQGDTLSKIARSELGVTSRWREIWDLNKGRIADPNLIAIGWELVLPKS